MSGILIPTVRVEATLKRELKNTFRLEVICRACKRRGMLWFNNCYKILAHHCPNCGSSGLDSPIWLSARKITSFQIFKK